MEGAQSPSPIFHQENDSGIAYITTPMDEPEPSSFNLRLIEAVRNSRCLYDAKDRQYRSADHKIKVWNHLVQRLNFDGDARTLYNRWKQLRDKYGKEKKKMKYSSDQTGWQYFKHLTFLDPHMIDRQQQQFARAKDGKTSHNIVITDPNFSSNLIQEVQRHPCLYDIRDSKYRHSECRNQAWSEIIKHLNFPGDINAIYKQWKKVRDRYVREKRKIRMSNVSGETDESQWELFPQMMWIDPYLDDRATTYRHVKRKRDSEELSDDCYLDDIVSDPNARQDSPQHSNSQLHSPYTTMVIQTEPQHHVKTLSHTHQAHVQSGDLIQSDLSVTDGDRAFAVSVYSDMRALPEPARAIAKAQIQNWLDNSRIIPQNQIQFEVK
uniref:Alcohol dehydrogenase transcription factor myb/sant-like protein n=1 Tax=Syphacia muris TaxID=451379 RepID=A0A0N5AZ76_9BILA